MRPATTRVIVGLDSSNSLQEVSFVKSTAVTDTDVSTERVHVALYDSYVVHWTMYGRAKLDLLRQRVLYAAYSTCEPTSRTLGKNQVIWQSTIIQRYVPATLHSLTSFTDFVQAVYILHKVLYT